MPEPASAAGQLERILYILPRAAREGGISLAELSETLGVDPSLILKDLYDVTARAYYHRAGDEDLLLEIEGGHVTVFNPGAFRRPVRLSVPEAVCLGMAMRGRLAERLAGGSGSETDIGSRRLLRALETTLSSVPVETLLASFEAADLRPDPWGIRRTLILAVDEREACRLEYLKPSGEAPEHREVLPYAMVHGEGHWYLLAHCTASDGVRTFRLDRILDVAPTGERFPPPEGFDPGAHIQGGRVFLADQETDVVVRYSPAVARWIAEKEAGERSADGSFTVTYPVADPHWIVRHVLLYGPDAEVLAPPEARKWVLAAVRCWLESNGH